jgi:hypothetical protein
MSAVEYCRASSCHVEDSAAVVEKSLEMVWRATPSHATVSEADVDASTPAVAPEMKLETSSVFVVLAAATIAVESQDTDALDVVEVSACAMVAEPQDADSAAVEEASTPAVAPLINEDVAVRVTEASASMMAPPAARTARGRVAMGYAPSIGHLTSTV